MCADNYLFKYKWISKEICKNNLNKLLCIVNTISSQTLLKGIRYPVVSLLVGTVG